MPALTGNGLAMRAGMVLEALAVDYTVHLLVVPVDDPAGRLIAGPEVSRWCAGIAVLPVMDHEHPLFRLVARAKDPRERLAAYQAYPKPSRCRFATSRAVEEVIRAFPAVTFSAVHVFRLYLAPFVEPYLCASPAARPICSLDLDDHESRKARRLAALYAAAGDETAAAIQRSEAGKYAAMEQRSLPRFDRVYVCSEADRVELAYQCGCRNLFLLPNGVRIPTTESLEMPAKTPFTFLFVGNLGYYPNDDAAMFFCTDVLPRLRATVRQDFRVMLVGTNPSPRVLALSAQPHVTVTGAVPDVARYYREADVVVAPIRAGGGTRIKLLEAFSHGRPVVATRISAEGIDVRDGVELRLADSPSDFAARCAELMTTPALGQRLATRAFAFVTERHSPSKILELLRQDHAGSGLAAQATQAPGS
jgi:glycosyltransferase involved in cell wall biosynthesis